MTLVGMMARCRQHAPLMQLQRETKIQTIAMRMKLMFKEIYKGGSKAYNDKTKS